MSILVTGGLGFVGAHICRLLAEAGEDVIAYDFTGRVPNAILEMEENYRKKIKLIRGSITDLVTLLRTIKENKTTGIISSASIIDGADSIPTETFSVNVGGCVNICEAARLMDLHRIVFFSTQGVYGAQKDLNPIKEDAPLNPTAGIYQLSKFLAEWVGNQYARQFSVNFVAIRPSFIFGPGQNVNIMYPLNVILANAMKNEAVSWSQGGDHPIDYSYVKDVAAGAIALYNAKKPAYLVYNLTGGKLVTTREIVDIVKKHFPTFPISVGPGYFEQFGAFNLAKILTGPLDNSRIMSDLGWKHPYGFKKGLEDYIEYLRKHPSEVEQMYVATRTMKPTP